MAVEPKVGCSTARSATRPCRVGLSAADGSADGGAYDDESGPSRCRRSPRTRRRSGPRCGFGLLRAFVMLDLLLIGTMQLDSVMVYVVPAARARDRNRTGHVGADQAPSAY